MGSCSIKTTSPYTLSMVRCISWTAGASCCFPPSANGLVTTRAATISARGRPWYNWSRKCWCTLAHADLPACRGSCLQVCVQDVHARGGCLLCAQFRVLSCIIRVQAPWEPFCLYSRSIHSFLMPRATMIVHRAAPNRRCSRHGATDHHEQSPQDLYARVNQLTLSRSFQSCRTVR